MRHGLISVPVLAVALGLLCAPSALSATTLGRSCALGGADMEVVTMDAATIATSAGVITRWGIAEPGFDLSGLGARAALYLLDPGTSTDSWTVASVTDVPFNASGQVNQARIPIRPGQAIAHSLSDPSNPVGAWWCSVPGATLLKAAATSQPVPGTALSFSSSTPDRSTAIWAAVEPDVDGDGFGDETQDSCPQSALTQTICPPIALAATRVAWSRGFKAITTANLPGTVAAGGTVKLPADRGRKASTLKFKSKALAVAPGRLTTVTLKFPKRLTSALKTLRRKKRLTVKVALNTTGPGSTATKRFTLKIRGQRR